MQLLRHGCPNADQKIERYANKHNVGDDVGGAIDQEPGITRHTLPWIRKQLPVEVERTTFKDCWEGNGNVGSCKGTVAAVEDTTPPRELLDDPSAKVEHNQLE